MITIYTNLGLRYGLFQSSLTILLHMDKRRMQRKDSEDALSHREQSISITLIV